MTAGPAVGLAVGPWLLAVVDGPSEYRAQRIDGVMAKLIEPSFGEECAADMTVMYWRQLRRSPLRGEGLSRQRGFAFKAEYAAKLAKLTAYGVVLLADNDNDRGKDRLAELRRGIERAQANERAAVGVARQMLEAWLLADPEIRQQALPHNRSCEQLWGDKGDLESNHPKHVLRRCVQEPNDWQLHDVIEAWRPGRARPHAPSLDAFMGQIEELARRLFDVDLG